MKKIKFFLLVILAIPTLVFASNDSKSKCLIEWEQDIIEINAFSGTSQVEIASFTSQQDIEDVKLWLTPGLERLINIENGEIESVVAGDKNRIFLAISIPSGTELGEYEGTLHIRGNNKRTFPSVLKITLNVVKGTREDIPSGFSFPHEDRIIEDGEYLLIRDEVLVGLDFELEKPENFIRDIAKQTNGVFMGSLNKLRVYQLNYDIISVKQLYELIEIIKGHEEVTFAAPNNVSENPFLSTVPNDNIYDEDGDGNFSEEWEESNPDGYNWALEYTKMPSAWEFSTGKRDVKIGIIDLLVSEHVDLMDNLDIRKSAFHPLIYAGRFINNHGTKVAGTACARGNNNIGITGVSWQCSLNSFEATTANKYLFFWAWALKAMEDAVDADMKVVNISMGAIGTTGKLKILTEKDKKKSEEINKTLSQAIKYAKQQNKDILWIFAAGNSSMDAQYEAPAGLTKLYPDNTITVSSIDKNGNLPSWANYGKVVTVAAPGVDMITTDGKSDYLSVSGTSYSAPFVAGLASLLISYDDNLRAKEVKNLIVRGAERGNKLVSGENFYVVNAKESFCELLNDNHPVCQQENHPPVLSFLESGPYAGDGMSQVMCSSEQGYSFNMIYSDHDNDPPQGVRVIVEGVHGEDLYLYNDIGIGGFLPDEDYINGVELLSDGSNGGLRNHCMTLPIGSFSYHFETSDGKDSIRFPEVDDLHFDVVQINNQPEITLIGRDAMRLFRGTIYNEPGATAFDDEDGDITPSIVIGGDTVNTLVPGIYTVTYNVTDSHELEAEEVTRTVTVTLFEWGVF